MNLVSRCVEAVKRFDNRFLFVGPQVVLRPSAAKLLASHNLVIADVGAAGGVDSRWGRLKEYCRFLTFEPQPEEIAPDPKTKNFAICLGAQQEKRALHLAVFPQCSSMLPANMERLKDFAVADCFRTVREVQVEVDTLDNCLSGNAQWTPDFLKVDVEGVELDVLKGSEQALQNILGLRVEVNFLQRHKNAPVFGEVDAFLRRHGFELFVLTRESMMRGNLLHMPLSQPQIVWGDSIYFLTKQKFLQRLSKLAAKEREVLLTKFIAILLSHWIHDYALEITEAAESEKLVTPDFAAELKQMVQKSANGSGTWLLKAFGGAFLATLIYLVSLPSRQARRSATFYLKQRTGCLFYYFWRITARGGEHNASVSDLLM